MYDVERKEVLKWMLGRIYRAERLRMQLDARLVQLREEMNSPIGGIEYDPMPKGQGEGLGAASLIFKMGDVEERIKEQCYEFKMAVASVMDILDHLPVDSVEREICELYYIDRKTWDEVAVTAAISRRQCIRIRDTALDILLASEAVREMVDAREEEYRLCVFLEDERRRKKAAEARRRAEAC